MFERRRIYNRRKEIHEVYGGQQQGGICTPSNHPMILLFTNDRGAEFGYKDGWTEEGIYLYTGEGQTGDMSFIRGNLAIRDHVKNGRDIHLFRYMRQGVVQYVDQMKVVGFRWREGEDVNKNLRKIIVFELVPIDRRT